MSDIFKNFDDKDINKLKQNEEIQKLANDKNIKDFVNSEQFNKFKKEYNEKSEDEILQDAKVFSQKLKQQYGEEEYNKKIQSLKRMEGFLNSEQKKKMKKFLDTLK